MQVTSTTISKAPMKKHSEAKPNRNSSVGLSSLEIHPSVVADNISIPVVFSSERLHRNAFSSENTNHQGCSFECKDIAREFYIMKDTVNSLTQQLATMQEQLKRHGLLGSAPASPSPQQHKGTQLLLSNEDGDEDKDELLMSEAMILPNENESFRRQVSEGLPPIPLHQSNRHITTTATQITEQTEQQHLIMVEEEEEVADPLAPLAPPVQEDAILDNELQEPAAVHRRGITDKDLLKQKQEIEYFCQQIEKYLDPMDESSSSPSDQRHQTTTKEQEYDDEISALLATTARRLHRNSRKAITDNDIDHCKEDIEFLRKQMAFKYMSMMDLSDRAESAEFLTRQMPFKFKFVGGDDEDSDEEEEGYY